MKKIVLLFLFSGLFLAATQFCTSCSSQTSNGSVWADSVKAEFLHAWRGYKTYAWGQDQLLPLSKKGKNWYPHSLLMTPVDAFDTMYLMGLEDELPDVKQLIVQNLSFDRDMSVNVFEVNIRLLGGLLSAYQLDGDRHFLQLAQDLGKRLLPAFHSTTGMPYQFVNLKTGAVSGNISNPAEIGTFIVEFGMLTRFTGDSVFYKTAKKALKALFARRSPIGLVGTSINVDTGAWVDRTAHIGGMIDSYYEYLLKGFILFADPELGAMWRKSVSAVNTYLADEAEDNLWYGRADMNSGKLRKPWFGALDAFFPAVLALDGQMDRAYALMNSCFKMWQLQGIEPELLNYRTMKILSPEYPLRPEIMESAYYLYYFTRDRRYRDMGRTMFLNLKKYCRTPSGYAALKDVITKEKTDQMESFFLAETMKYLYLLFADPATINLNKTVFNTEAHPMFLQKYRVR